jgi:hypothetical protein
MDDHCGRGVDDDGLDGVEGVMKGHRR